MEPSMTAPVRWGVLASGSGTNLQALIDADLTPGALARLIVNRPGCGAAQRAERAGLPWSEVDHRDLSREEFERRLVERFRQDRVDWVVLAGFMRVLGPTFLAAFPGRVINIHPALLPAFPGLDAQRQAFDAGVRVAGCTVHLVDAGVDTGPILAQAAVPVLDGDDLESLRRRILAEEHRLLPAVVRAISEGQLELAGPRPRWRAARSGLGALRSPELAPSPGPAESDRAGGPRSGSAD
jgi:phosphoribosylglycinamide formyltransferase 1